MAGRWVFIVESPAQAEEARGSLRQGIASVYLNVDYHQELLITHGFGEEVAAAKTALAHGDFEGAANSITDRMVDTFAIIGTADECLERVAEYTSLVNSFTVSTLTGRMSRPEGINAVRKLIRTFGS
jgi:alkanesulfonate monooxygenase SsuD/methylene tetrahydromethanopterin reductase-like flavin-dependent oxidoreductase (luciferase family)